MPGKTSESRDLIGQSKTPDIQGISENSDPDHSDMIIQSSSSSLFSCLLYIIISE